jgi:hypothetical protein
MSAFLEILIELSVRLLRFVLRNFRVIFSLAVGAGLGLGFGLSLARFGGVSGTTLLLFIVIGAAVVAPAVIAFLGRIAPKGQ